MAPRSGDWAQFVVSPPAATSYPPDHEFESLDDICVPLIFKDFKIPPRLQCLAIRLDLSREQATLQPVVDLLVANQSTLQVPTSAFKEIRIIAYFPSWHVGDKRQDLARIEVAPLRDLCNEMNIPVRFCVTDSSNPWYPSGTSHTHSSLSKLVAQDPKKSRRRLQSGAKGEPDGLLGTWAEK
ncbi:hypothetical protein NLI96_g309 [Meripilus lineatus]|uniref:Uncharacterized protein n=1 Tax=Meripilus lineatus TaxID=2056292 RepID=A0AAD5VE16_9APHY|nr:hypothetical protein NLI96_g309 [Physisporinus lineatus]